MITTLTGKNNYELTTCLDSLRASWFKANPDSPVETYLAENIVETKSFINDLRTVSLFGGGRLVILKYISGNKEIQELVLKYGSDIPDDIHLVIYDPELDLRTKLAKWLKNHSEWVEARELDALSLQRWLGEEVKSRNLKLSSALQAYLVNKGVNTQTKLDQELTKLESYTGEISKEALDELIVPTIEDDIFAFLDAFTSSNRRLAIQYLNSFEHSKMEPGYILNMIIWQLNILVVAISTREPMVEVSRQASLSVGALRRAQSLKSKLSVGKLKLLVNQIAKIDANFYEGDNWQQLEMFVISNT